MSSMVLLLPKVLVRPNKELGGGDIARAFILFTGGKSWKARCHLIFLMTINRKWCCSKSSTSPFHTVEHQFGQRMFLRHCTLCASHGWGADLEFGQFSALASLYKFKQIMITLSQPSHDTEVRRGLELTSWDAAVPHFSLYLACGVMVYLVRTRQKHRFPANHALFPASHHGISVHFHFGLCNPSPFEATTQCHLFFPN